MIFFFSNGIEVKISSQCIFKLHFTIHYLHFEKLLSHEVLCALLKTFPRSRIKHALRYPNWIFQMKKCIYIPNKTHLWNSSDKKKPSTFALLPYLHVGKKERIRLLSETGGIPALTSLRLFLHDMSDFVVQEHRAHYYFQREMKYLLDRFGIGHLFPPNTIIFFSYYFLFFWLLEPCWAGVATLLILCNQNQRPLDGTPPASKALTARVGRGRSVRLYR